VKDVIEMIEIALHNLRAERAFEREPELFEVLEAELNTALLAAKLLAKKIGEG
jgi:hypothetical protein